MPVAAVAGTAVAVVPQAVGMADEEIPAAAVKLNNIYYRK
jgi:hypothetical protein